ncbi:SH2 domain-containing protein 3A isoform X1 [Vombatus ursinus]|uniref:SH2 domain containing 3A n=1 Tax=Vombatus ursinus TaxID=29139 RepID=A0A4X2MDZ0_VOMUR|nr:SH2 domain-containing protein 3A isoform X1 [Vombatus ursinus]XP_027706635.1 SH2 domain-containing protein 3A isoform X1 [Vombatus ursinus]XP_027706636.1 SH2 domain-containing protein 3A isoform X1 [Vombatus ursinus]XP_027706637.1 SH2 domain-containing protein 3A isoform X1 [Vombatus ursinus]
MEKGEEPLDPEKELFDQLWYHGELSQKEAEALLLTDGDFLAWASTSTSVLGSGPLMLSCCRGGRPLHFEVVRIQLRPRPGRPHALFQLEDERFPSLPALVNCYVTTQRPLSQASGAVASHPVARCGPPRPTTFGKPYHHRRSLSGDDCSNGVHPVHKGLLRSKELSGSQPASLDILGHKGGPKGSKGPGSPDDPQMAKVIPPASPLFRTGSDPILRRAQLGMGIPLWGSDGQLHPKVPPKPPRAPSVMLPPTSCELMPQEIVQGKERHGEEAGTGEEAGPGPRDRQEMEYKTEALPGEEAVQRDEQKNLHGHQAHLSNQEGPQETPWWEEGEQEEAEDFVRPQGGIPPALQPQAFSSCLLGPENRPLEPSALRTLRALFLQHDVGTVARHLLLTNCQAAQVLGVTQTQRQAMGVHSGLELLTLPHGHQLRLNLLERHEALALAAAIAVVGCSGPVAERVATLLGLIQLALALRAPGGTGDLFALSSVMTALQLPQITRLEQTWRLLRQNHTEAALAFEKELKPFVRALDEGAGIGQPGEVALPHIVPVAQLLEGVQLWGSDEESCERLLWTLQGARTMANNASHYCEAARARLKGFQPTPELCEAFQTEFALRLLWGSRGAGAGQAERHKKFHLVLSALSRRLEPEG